jgi:hypothetical protein
MQMIDPKDEIKKEQPIPVQEAKSTIEYWPIEDIPSKYKLYPANTKILGRPLKVPEVKKLALMNENNFNFVINEVLKSSIQGINIDDLLVADKVYIIMWLRANTYRESGYIMPFKCSQCEKESSYEFNLDALEIKYIKDDYDPLKLIELKTGDNLLYSYLKVKDEQIANKFKQSYINSMFKIDDEILDLAITIRSINGKEMSTLEKYEFINTLKAEDYVYLISYIKQYDIGIKPYINAKCTECGGITPVGITFSGSFFIPGYKFR